MNNARRISLVLWGLLVLDGALASIAFTCPQLWFQLFHGIGAPSDLVYFRRSGAQWAGFALVQAVALGRWRKEPRWLAAVAGVRLCDIFTDWTALAFMHERTLFAWLALIAVAPANAAIAKFLFTRAKPS